MTLELDKETTTKTIIATVKSSPMLNLERIPSNVINRRTQNQDESKDARGKLHSIES